MFYWVVDYIANLSVIMMKFYLYLFHFILPFGQNILYTINKCVEKSSIISLSLQ